MDNQEPKIEKDVTEVFEHIPEEGMIATPENIERLADEIIEELAQQTDVPESMKGEVNIVDDLLDNEDLFESIRDEVAKSIAVKAKKKLDGRPTVITPLVLDKLREAFMMGCTDTEACLYSNISPSPLYKFQEKYPKFQQLKDFWKDNPLLLARKNIHTALSEGNINVSQWYAERKNKNEFAVRTELTGKDGKDLIPIDPEAKKAADDAVNNYLNK